MVDQLVGDYPDRFAALTMHVNGDGFDTPWGQNRLDGFYGLAAAVPTFVVDALWICEPSDYRYCVEQQLAQPTDTTLELAGNHVQGNTWDIIARVCLEAGSSRPVRVLTAATLDHRPGLPGHATHVLMQDVFETDISLSTGGCQEVTTRITLDPQSGASPSDVVIIAWAQKPGSSAPATVYQAAIMRWPFPTDSQLTTIEVTPAEATVQLGDEVEFTAAGKDQSGAPYPLDNPVWTLGGSGSGLGTFDPGSGSATTTFTATRAGNRQVQCSDGGVTGGALVHINEAPVLTSIEIDPASATVGVDGEVSFTATGVDQYSEDFPLEDPVWSVSGTGDGTFDPTTGAATTFTASYPGACVVTCSDGDVSATATVEVTGDDPRLATITLSPASGRIRVGDELELTASGRDQYGRARELADPAWRVEGDGDGHLNPSAGSPTTTFTATAPGSARVVCSDDGVEGTATLEIAPAGLPAPRKVKGRVAP